MARYSLGLDATESGAAALDWISSLPLTGEDVVKVVTITGGSGLDDRRAEDALERARTVIRTRRPEAHVVTVHARQPIVDRLVEESESADLLVIGSHRTALLRSLATGWLPERIAVGAHCPTVVVPDDWNRFDGDGDVVVGVDSPEDETAALAGARFAALFARTLVLVEARATPVRVGSDAGSPPLLVAVVDRIRTAFPQLDVRTRSETDRPDAALARAADDALLLVVGREHRTAAAVGSVAARLMHTTRTALCIVPPRRYGGTSERSTEGVPTGAAGR